MDTQAIKSVGCSRSQSVVTIHLQCTSIKQAGTVFDKVRAAIKDAEEAGRDLAFCAVDGSAARAAEAEAAQ